MPLHKLQAYNINIALLQFAAWVLLPSRMTDLLNEKHWLSIVLLFCVSSLQIVCGFAFITHLCKPTDGNYPPFLNGHEDLSWWGGLTFLHQPSIPWSNFCTEATPGWEAIRFQSIRDSYLHKPGSVERPDTGIVL